jgi:metal-responsive CopG/Arc/MetJ family transcriptional regulator
MMSALHHQEVTQMRAVIDIPNSLLGQLDSLAASKGVSRAEVMRQALGNYVQACKPEQIERFYGLWQDRAELRP